MSNEQTRRFSLIDAMVLVAATAVGLFLVRLTRAGRFVGATWILVTAVHFGSYFLTG